MVGAGNRGGFRRPNGGDRRSGPIKTEDRDRSRSPQRDRRSQGGDQGKNDRMVFISNLSYQTRWLELKSLVREKGGEMNFIELLEDKDGRPKGSALVEFKEKEGADECIKNLNRFEFQSRSIVAKEIRDPAAFLRKIKEETGIDFLARSGGHSGARVDDGGNRPQRSGTYDLFGLSPDFLRKHHIDPPLCERIFIANLAYNVGTAKIYEIFGLAGKITWMDLHMDKEGRSKGVCVVQFSHPIEAVQAISMFNGQKLYDRILAVKMDQFEKTEKPREGGLPRGLECLGMGLGAEGAPLRDVASVVSQMSSISANVPVPVPVAPVVKNEPYMGMGSSVFPSSFTSSGMNAPNLNTVSNGMGTGGFGAAGYGAASSGGFSQQTYGSPSNIFGNRATNCLQIKNLPNDYTWQIVRDRLTQFGEIDSLDLPTAGVARVRFLRVQDAERTRGALAGTSVEGRSIAVEYV